MKSAFSSYYEHSNNRLQVSLNGGAGNEAPYQYYGLEGH